MQGYTFKNMAAVQAAISILPPELTGQGVKYSVLSDGAVNIASEASGVLHYPVTTLEAETNNQGLCWAEIIPAVKSKTESGDRFIFVVEAAGALNLAAEFMRLGVERVSWSFQKGKCLIRVSDPPYYLITQAADRIDNLQVFNGTSRVWIEVGFSHPFAGNLTVDASQILLIPGKGRWEQYADTGWVSILENVDLRLPQENPPEIMGAPKDRIHVPMRLVRGPVRPASLWFVSDPNAIDAFVQESPEVIINKLDFAVLEDETIILRGRGKGADIEIQGVAYASWPILPDIYLPVGYTVDPPLRRDLMKERLAPLTGEIGWAESIPNPGKGEAQFRIRKVKDTDFYPLSTWVDYVVEREINAIDAWVRSSVFDFDSIVDMAGTSDVEIPKIQKKAEKPSKAPVSHTPVKEKPIEVKTKPATVEVVITAPIPEPLRVVSPSAIQSRLLELQTDFLRNPGAERPALWKEMGDLYAKSEQPREAGLCWTRAIWIDSSYKEQWYQWERSISKMEPDHVLNLNNPSREQIRLIAAWVCSKEMPQEKIHTVQIWLDQYDKALDLRSFWISRKALSDKVGGDAILLSKARDHVWSIIQHGLPMSKDAPTFLRHAGKNTEGTSINLEAHLDELHYKVTHTKRVKHTTLGEGNLEITYAYIGLIFAWGFAKIGASDRANVLRDASLQTLKSKMADRLHYYTTTAFSTKIDQANQGEHLEISLPDKVNALLQGLDKMERVKADRLRIVSEIIESQENRSYQEAVYAARLRGVVDPRTAMLNRIKTATFKEAAITDALQEALTEPMMDGILDGLLLCSVGGVRSVYLKIHEQLKKNTTETSLSLWTKALKVSNILDLTEWQGLIINEIVSLLKTTPITVASVGINLTAILKGIRKAGKESEALQLLAMLKDKMNQAPVSVLCAVAGGYLAAGNIELGRYYLQSAMKTIAPAAPTTVDAPYIKVVKDRLAVIRAIAKAASQGTPEFAVGILSQLVTQLPYITDFHDTRSHFCLSALEFSECMVLCLADDSLALGDVGRRWLNEDEHQLRKKIHQECG